MSKGPGRKTKHHRKPRSLGGHSGDGNISIVTRREHEAWHCLFSNLPAPEILGKLKSFYDLFSEPTEESEKIKIPWCVTEQWKAWTILFGNMFLEDIVNIINIVWIDPDYKLVITSELAKKVSITRRRR